MSSQRARGRHHGTFYLGDSDKKVMMIQTTVQLKNQRKQLANQSR